MREKNTLGLAIIVYVAQNVLEFKGDSRLGGTFFGIRFQLKMRGEFPNAKPI